jgi:hypothetical protein
MGHLAKMIDEYFSRRIFFDGLIAVADHMIRVTTSQAK